MKKIAIALFGMVFLAGCGATTSREAPSVAVPSVAVPPAADKERVLLDRAAAQIEGSIQTHASAGIPFLTATISEPYSENQLLTGVPRTVYCVEMRIDTVLMATGARAKISIEQRPEGDGRMTVEVSRGIAVSCTSRNPRPFEKLIELRNARSKRYEADRQERQRQSGGSPALVL